MPMGNRMAPANKKPHKPCAKHVKTCVNHAAMQTRPMICPMPYSPILYSSKRSFKRLIRLML